MKKVNFSLSFFAFLFMVFNLSGQATFVEFHQNVEKTGKTRGLLAFDVFAYGDHDGKGIVNSANIIIDNDFLGNYEIHQWESCVSSPGNGITYTPKPYDNPILNYVCLEGVKSGDRIGTLWLSKKRDIPTTKTSKTAIATRYQDLFFYSKVDGEKLDSRTSIDLSDLAGLEVSIFPNPFLGEIHFRIKDKDRSLIKSEDPIDVLLLDISGRVHAEFRNMAPESNFHQRLLLPNIPIGTYFLSIRQNNAVIVESDPIIKTNY